MAHLVFRVLSFLLLSFVLSEVSGQSCNTSVTLSKKFPYARFQPLSPLQGPRGRGFRLTCICSYDKPNPRMWSGPAGSALDGGAHPVTQKSSKRGAVLILQSAITCSDAGVYTCTLDGDSVQYLLTPLNGMECSPANVTIVGSPSEPVKVNTNVQLMCSADNPTNSPLVYTWSTNSEELSGENMSTLVVSVKENITVTCTVRNDVGNSSATTTIAVTVLPVSSARVSPSSLTPSPSPVAPSQGVPSDDVEVSSSDSLATSSRQTTSDSLTSSSRQTTSDRLPPLSTQTSSSLTSLEVVSPSVLSVDSTTALEVLTITSSYVAMVSSSYIAMDTSSHVMSTSSSVSMDASSYVPMVTTYITMVTPSVAMSSSSRFTMVTTSHVAMDTSSNVATDTSSHVAMDTSSVSQVVSPVNTVSVLSLTSKMTSVAMDTSTSVVSTSGVDTSSATFTTLTASTPLPSTASPSPLIPSPSSPPPPMVQPPSPPSVVDGKVAVTVGWSRVVGAQKLSLMYSWTTLWTNRAKRETANSRQVTLDPTDTSYTVEDADGYSMYCFTLTATYSGDVQSSADQVCQDTPATKPSVPVDVQISQVMSTSLVVSWGIPLRPNGKITSFKVSYTAQDSVRVEYSQYLSQGGMWRLTELTPNTLYSIEVTAVNSEGEGPSSPSYRLTTAEQPTEPPQSSSLTVIIIVVVVVVVILVLIVLIIISVIVLCIMRNRHKQYAREETMFGLDMEMKERGKDGNHFETKTPEGLDSPVVELSEDVIETSAGAATLVYVNVEGTPTPQVVWSKDGDFLDEKSFIILSEGSLFIPLTRPQDGGTYTITAANSHGRSSVEVLLDVAVQIPPSPDPDHPPIGEDKFPEVVANLRANDENGFNEEYDTLDMDEWKLTTHASKAIVNYSKNRYINIIPYDHSRVVLELLGDLPGTDYINASWIDGYKQKRAYIACQGPLPNYIEDFWRMIWQYQIQTIVMVTNLMEGQKIKCHRYWPESGSTSFGMYEVTLKKEEKLAEYTVRDLVVNVPRSKGPLTLKQFHFTSWPDHGVPLYATGLLSFRNRVNKHQQSFAHIPIVVHCSAGVGRTGTYIAIDTMLKKKDDEGVVDVFDCVRKLRWQRRYMVQTVSQYVFVYNSLLEAVMCGETCVSVQNFRQRLAELSTKTTDNQTRCGDEFEKLQITSPLVEDFACEVAVGNSSKNRDSIYLPPDDSRVQLEEAEEEGSSDYVNASYLDGYSQQKAFIVAQVPLVKTQSDFWSMIWEQNSHVISLLTQPEENDKELSVQYWPSGDGETKQYGTVTVKLVSEDSVNSDYVARKLKIWRENKEEESHSITQFHYTNWPEGGCPGNAGSLIELINDLQRIQRKSGNHPITVQCSNGVGRSGALCALMTALERVKTEQIVDVFRAVKSLRIQRPGIVPTFEQYDFLYHGILEYLTSFDNYSNFK